MATSLMRVFFLSVVTLAACSGGGVPPVVQPARQPAERQQGPSSYTAPAANVAFTCPPPTPEPAGMPAITRLYITNSCSAPTNIERDFISVYDENGKQLHATRTFPSLSRPGGATFDSVNHAIYVANIASPTVTVYNKQGNLLRTFSADTSIMGECCGAITFDALNRHLYIGGSSITVFDEQGNQVRVSGTFDGEILPKALTFDPANRRLYAATPFTANPISVFDENGNRVTTSGSFPHTNFPVGVTFDPCNRRIYVLNGSFPFKPTVYDENGNQVVTAGLFPNLTFPSAIAFDASNRHIYIANSITPPPSLPIAVFDENGNPVLASGGFPDVSSPLGIAVAPLHQDCAPESSP
jgi:DNA-binding beta-propeller fold protein YncE